MHVIFLSRSDLPGVIGSSVGRCLVSLPWPVGTAKLNGAAVSPKPSAQPQLAMGEDDSGIDGPTNSSKSADMFFMIHS